LANDLQVSKCVIASDCLQVITALKKNYRPSFSTVLNEIRSCSSEFMVVSFIHENRVSNGHSHDLAPSSLDLYQGRRLWLLNPPDTHIVPMLIE
jgi:hypothetical protein